MGSAKAGDYLVELLRERGVAPQDTRALCEMSEARWDNLIRGRTHWRPSDLVALAPVVGVTVRKLMSKVEVTERGYAMPYSRRPRPGAAGQPTWSEARDPTEDWPRLGEPSESSEPQRSASGRVAT